MGVNPRTTSRFGISDPILTRDGRETFGIAKKYRFLDRNNLNEGDVLRYTADHSTAGRPDRLAAELYNNQDLHWILIAFNRVDNPLNWPTNGQVIEYPSPSVVSSEI